MRREIVGVLAMAALFAGCSSDSSGGGTGTGGTTASGGSVGSGGHATGGASGSGTGGGQNGGISGGSATSGGGPSTGGLTSTGGLSGSGMGGSNGGSAGKGGTSVTGGSAGNGGTSATSGSAGKGGTSVTGGSAGNGGTSATGGESAAGGSGGKGGTLATGGSGGGGNTRWVGTWAASPYPLGSNDQPPASLSNSVVRQLVHVSLGGSQLRVQFSNLSGNGSVIIKSAHIALCKATPAVDSTIDTATDKALAFSGSETVTIAQGKEVWSDLVDFTVAPLGNISITTAFGTVPSTITAHAGSRTTSYLQPNSTSVSAASMTSAQTTDHWFYISGIDVMADAAAKAVVAIGDSITDGRGTDTNKNNRWTDILSARLQANSGTAKVAVLNQGIGATNLVGTSGTAAQARFNRDVLGQSGVKYAIVYDGVNDIGTGVSFASMKAAYDDLIGRAHAKGLTIYGATILPFGGNTGTSGYYSDAHESVRKQVNTYIKSGVFDGYIDFDSALTDGGNPPKLQTVYATWSQQDGLHPGPAGYQKMGDSIDLTLFTK